LVEKILMNREEAATTSIAESATDSKHDFVTKLRQPSLLPRLLEYIKWQRALRRAIALGETPEEAPEGLSPISLNLDPTTACGYDCTHCIDLPILNAKIKFDHEKLLSSLGNLIERGLRSVILIGGGEPTLYPKFKELVYFLKERGVQVAVVSNGSGNEDILDCARYFSKGDWVRLSLDSGTNDTFIAMHRPKKKNISLEGICAWVPLIRKANPALPVAFSYIVTWEGAQENGQKIISNIDEIVLATKLARNYGFSYIALKAFLTRHQNGAEVMDTKMIEDFDLTVKRIQDAIDEAKTYETEDFKVVTSTNLGGLEAGNWKDLMDQPKTCHKQWLQQVLSPWGVYNCPAHRAVPKAKIGGKDAYAEASEIETTKKSVVAILSRFNAHKECANTACPYNAMNWWIEKAINGELDPADMEALVEHGDYYF